MKAADDGLSIVPANEAAWSDIAAVFGARGEASRCFCQRYKLAPGEAFKSHPPEVRAERLRQQTRCDRPSAGRTSGLVAYLGVEAVGWCAIEPRTAYAGLMRVYRVPWQGRAEDKADTGVWAVTCLLVRAGYRRRGLSTALARAAVDFAQARGARAVEAYPMIIRPGQEITWGELHVGSRSVFAAAGLQEVTRSSRRRIVMRVEFFRDFRTVPLCR